MVEALPLSDEVFVEAGYIRVYQDVRGKYGSEGPYLMTPPPVASGYQPHRGGRYDRCLRHDRLAGKKCAGVERPRRHDRIEL